MKTKIIILLLIVFSIKHSFAQTDSLSIQEKIRNIETELAKQQAKLDDYYKELDKEYRTYRIVKQQFNQEIKQLSESVDSVNNTANSNAVNIEKTANELGVKIEKTTENTSDSLTDLNKTVSQATLYWIIAALFILLLIVLVFFLLKKQIFKQKTDLNKGLEKTRTDLDQNIQKTRTFLEEEAVKLDNKLIGLLETQLKIINNTKPTTGSEVKKEEDHTLALKVADEIIRIQKNLTRMDEKTKGLKQLKASVKRIQDNFAANGYEIVDMLGKPFNEGMKVSANFIPDEDLESGQQIITRIIKPQVNYKGVMIQSAQIEVSQG